MRGKATRPRQTDFPCPRIATKAFNEEARLPYGHRIDTEGLRAFGR